MRCEWAAGQGARRDHARIAAPAVLLITIAYGPTLVRLAITTPLDLAGMRVW